MKIHILSDLHLGFSNFILKDLNADVIILAGDIDVGMKGMRWAAELLDSTLAHVIYVCGNHEFYDHDINILRKEMREFCKDSKNIASVEAHQRLHFLDDSEVIIDGVRILGTCLWTDFCLFGEHMKKECMVEGQHYLNDFRLISQGELIFSTQNSIELHNASVKWLTNKLLNETFTGKTVVVTHHLPSSNSVVARYSKDLLSACFASNLDHLLGFSELWIHGHTHDSLDYLKNGTRVICNPRGYCRYNTIENRQFNPNLIVEI